MRLNVQEVAPFEEKLTAAQIVHIRYINLDPTSGKWWSIFVVDLDFRDLYAWELRF